MATETILTPTCTNCGELCTDGYTVKMLGERDRETGYQDEEIICGDCFQVDLEDRSWDLRAIAFDRIVNLYAALDIVRGARRQLEVGECFYNPAWQKLCRIEWGLEEQIRAVA